MLTPLPLIPPSLRRLASENMHFYSLIVRSNYDVMRGQKNSNQNREKSFQRNSLSREDFGLLNRPIGSKLRGNLFLMVIYRTVSSFDELGGLLSSCPTFSKYLRPLAAPPPLLGLLISKYVRLYSVIASNILQSSIKIRRELRPKAWR